MSYQAIARKWRPTTFDQVVGQGHVTRTLRNAIERERIHHAFLFTGARGVGKTTCARAFARCLNCDQGPTPKPCGTCQNCVETLAGSAPDVVEIDGASNNSVEDVRKLRETVGYLPARGRYRIYLIDEVHMLSTGAFNALLKTLEEPPPHVVFLFATTEPQKIPDTVLSRVQRFDFKRIPAGVVVGRLRIIVDAEGVGISDVALRMIARSGEGSMRDSESLLDQVIAFGGQEIPDDEVAKILGLVDRSLLFGMLEGLLAGEPDKCLEAIHAVYEYGYDLPQFTSEFLELLRNAALVVLSEESQRYLDIPEEEKQRLADLCQGLDESVFSRWFQVMLQVHDQVSRSSRPRLVLEMAVARLSTVRRVQPVDHLLARLERLEKRLRDGGVTPPRGPGDGGGGGNRSFADVPRREERPRSAQGPGRSESRRTRSAGSAPAPPSKPTEPAPGPPPAPIDAQPAAPPRAPYDVKPAASPPPVAPPEAVKKPPPRPKKQASPVARASSEPVLSPVDLQASWQAFCHDLGDLGMGAQSLRDHSVLERQDGAVLRVGFASERTLRRGRQVVSQANVLAAVQRHFPGVGRLEAVLRASADSGQTRRERTEAAKAAHLEQLWEEARSEPRIAEAVSRFGATIHQVIPLSEPEKS